MLSAEKKLYFKNLIFSYLPHFGQIFVFMIITPLLLNTFGREKYGVYVLLYTIISYFGLTNIGLPQTLIRELIGAKENNDHVKINCMINSLLRYYSIIVGVIMLLTFTVFYMDLLGVVGIIVRDARYRPLFKYGMVLVSVSFSLKLLSEIFEAVVMAENKIYSVKIISFFQIMFTGVMTYFILKTVGRMDAVLVGNIAVSAVTLVLLLLVSKKIMKYDIDLVRGDWRVFRSMIPSSFWYLMSGISVIIIFYVDDLVVSSIIGLSAVAVYSLMFRFTNFARQILSLIPNTLFPKVAKMHSEKRFMDIRILHNKVLAIMVLVSATAGVLLYFPGYNIFRWWIGRENSGSLNVFYLFILFSVFFSINQVSGLFLGAMGHHRNGVIMGLIQGGVNLILSIILAKKMGITGVIIATVVSLAITNLWFNPYFFYRVIQNENSGS